MWCHLSTGIGLRRSLRFVALALLFVALTTTLLLARVSHATAGTNRTINFQGRLQTAAGAVVADGHYNMQFKIYQDGAGTAVGNPGGSLKWTETYINNGGTNGVDVKNGFFSVSLGSQNPFGTSVDWNQDTLFLSMNVAGSASACTTFGTSPCGADGEMLPMKRITATPYAINAGAVNGKTADNFVQLAQGVQTDASTNTSSIFINKTGSGNLIQLQNTATDVFTVDETGNLTLGSNADKSISVAVADPNTAGKQLSVSGGAGGSGSGSTGGDLALQGGAAGGLNGNGGDVTINAGAKTGTGTDGSISIGASNTSSITIGSTSGAGNQNVSIGANNTAGGSSNVIVGSGGSADSGSTTIQAKDSVTVNTDGVTRVTFGNSNTVYFGNGVTAAAPNGFTLQATGSSTAGVSGGSLAIQGGDANAGNTNGGNVTIAGGSGSGTGASGLVVINTPTFSTVTNDANCYAGGTTVASSCTISNSTVNNAAAVVVGFSATGQTATLPDPSITTAGRIMYVTAANGSEDFTLSINGGGTDNHIAMHKNVTASLLWNGSDWTSTTASNAPTPYSLGGSSSGGTPNVQVGDGVASGAPTLFTVDKASSPPVVTDSSLLGSMYYDTTIGKLQCYEAKGWGSCGSSPDTFVTLSPEYTNTVTNGNGIGTMTTDLCSDTLDINDGTSGQPTICGSNETYNFYNWTSSQGTAQTKSIYVTYKLPSTFKEFSAGLTSLMGRTDSSNSNVSYQIYRNRNSSGMTACGSSMPVSTGSQSTWQTKTASGSEDPSTCSFAAGDSIVFKINMIASSNANAYIANLGFTYSNN
ncbi:MAG: exported protein of unknown function [Candidatus Saccharibacteria bacterium]|nr:exported protein of unknown function [Candidatus Saccharibacteria bacterium]